MWTSLPRSSVLKSELSWTGLPQMGQMMLESLVLSLLVT
jgi:hypothetical protein